MFEFMLFVCFAGTVLYFVLRHNKHKNAARRQKEEIFNPVEDLMSAPGPFVGWEKKSLDDGSVIPGSTIYYSGDRHLVTIGPTGSGKAATSQVFAIAANRGSCLVIDVKGQLCAITARWRAAYWQNEVVALNPFDILGLPSATYNPLSHIDPHAITFASDCRRIAEGLVDVKKGDHWEISALDVVTTLIMWVIKYDKEKNLVRVRQILSLPEDVRKEFFRGIATANDVAIAEGAGRYTLDSNEVRDCIQTAVVQLGFIRDEAIASILQGGQNEISFANLKRRNMTAYVMIPPELLHTHGKFLRLVVMSALGELIRERTQPVHPVLFMLDEFAQLGHMALIENAVNIVRDYKIRLWIILQNLPQLKGLYGDLWESFLSSAGLIQVFTPNDMVTAEYFSRRSGQITETRKSESFMSGNAPGRSITYTETEVPALRPETLLSMAPHFMVVFHAGKKDYFPLMRLPYYTQPQFAGVFDADPYHMTTADRDTFEKRARQSQTLMDFVTFSPFNRQNPLMIAVGTPQSAKFTSA